MVNTVDCFDKLRVPPDHVSRSPSDTYYVNADYVLRTPGWGYSLSWGKGIAVGWGGGQGVLCLGRPDQMVSASKARCFFSGR